MKKIAIIGALAIACVAGIVLATGGGTTHGGVVELYTSENCVKCPAAEAEFNALSEAGLITLALHVDYQTLPTLRDPYALEPALDRQRSYALTSGQKMLFTPQFVVNGIPLPPGADAASVIEAMDSSSLLVIQIQAKAADDTLRITWPADGHPGDAWLFITEDNLANRSLYRDREKEEPHHRIVRYMEPINGSDSEVHVPMNESWVRDQLHATVVIHRDGRLVSAGTTRVVPN